MNLIHINTLPSLYTPLLFDISRVIFVFFPSSFLCAHMPQLILYHVLSLEVFFDVSSHKCVGTMHQSLPSTTTSMRYHVLAFGLATIGLALPLHIHFLFVKEFVSIISLGLALMGLVLSVVNKSCTLVLACFHF